MPKIIENLECRLIGAARRQLRESGYSAMTIRSVAKECAVGVGTVYNYFPSKDDLIAAYMLEDWKVCVDAIEEASRQADSPRQILLCIHRQLCQYADQNRGLFQDEAAASSYAGGFGRYHGRLREQLARPLRRFCPDDFTASFLAEAMLTWTMAGRAFDEIYGVLSKLL